MKGKIHLLGKKQVSLSLGCTDTWSSPRTQKLGSAIGYRALFGGTRGHPQGTEHNGTQAASTQESLNIKSILLLKNKLEKTKLSKRLLN